MIIVKKEIQERLDSFLSKELDISILNQNEKTVKNYSLRKIKNN